MIKRDGILALGQGVRKKIHKWQARDVIRSRLRRSGRRGC